MAFPSLPSWFRHPNNIFKQYKLRSSSLCSLLQSPITLSHSGPNILLRTSSVYVLPLTWQTNFYTHKRDTIKVLHIFVFTFLDVRREEKRFRNSRKQASPRLVCQKVSDTSSYNTAFRSALYVLTQLTKGFSVPTDTFLRSQQALNFFSGSVHT
jgi:hypothetical protein